MVSKFKAFPEHISTVSK